MSVPLGPIDLKPVAELSDGERDALKALTARSAGEVDCSTMARQTFLEREIV
jgi:hypothetical protein